MYRIFKQPYHVMDVWCHNILKQFMHSPQEYRTQLLRWIQYRSEALRNKRFLLFVMSFARRS